MSRILAIEDSPAISLLLRRRIEMRGHEFEVRANGGDALVRLDEGPLPDVILLDVIMPGIDGIETMRRIRVSHPQLPVILVTAQSLAYDVSQEADAVIKKPIEFDELFAAIDRHAPVGSD